MGFWSGFGIGLILGGCAGVFVMALMVAAKIGDNQLKGAYDTYEQSVGKIEK